MNSVNFFEVQKRKIDNFIDVDLYPDKSLNTEVECVVSK